MDLDRIGPILAKTAELRSKILTCIQKSGSNAEKEGIETESEELERSPDGEYQEDDGGEEAESLLNIKDALESLEAQLSSLQALLQQQWYDKEAALAEIEYSQKNLLKELKNYKGKDLEVIQEALAFASETEDNNDLLLPPYPSRPSHSFTSTRKFPQNGVKNHNEVPNDESESNNERKSEPCSPLNRVKSLISSAAKAAVTVVGVIAVLSLAGFEPQLRKRDDNQFKVMDLFQRKRDFEMGNSIECPPGKVAVMENGEMRCVVKERVEVPFESVVGAPDVSYGCG